MRLSLLPIVALALLGPVRAQTFVQEAYVKASNTDPADRLGTSVALSGNTLVVSSIGDDSDATGANGNQHNVAATEDSGAAFVFTHDGQTWTQQAFLKASNPDLNDRFGAVAISGDTIVVGTPWEDSNATGVDGDQLNNDILLAGAAYVFSRSGSTWTQEAYLKHDVVEQAWFGESVAVSGDTVVVGAPRADVETLFGTDHGVAHVFVRNGSSWVHQATLWHPDVGSGARFGTAVAIEGDTLVVGAEGEKDGGLNVGAAYVFVRTGSTWTHQARLSASNPDSEDSFGHAVAISGDTIAVSAPYESSDGTGQFQNNANFAGAVYVFQREGTEWPQQQYLKAAHPDQSDYFGDDISLCGDRLVIGASGEDSQATGVNGDQTDDTWLRSGAAYVFEREGGTFVQRYYLKASNTGFYDAYGTAVAVSGDHVVAGAPNEDSDATGINGDQASGSATFSGAAYAYDLVPWNVLGGGTGGAHGTSSLSMTGPLTPGSTLSLDLQDAAPSALAFLFISYTSSPVAFLGGTLHAFPFDALAVLATDPTGSIQGSTPFPGGPSGAQLWFQVGVDDATALPFGATLSNGVRGTVP